MTEIADEILWVSLYGHGDSVYRDAFPFYKFTEYVRADLYADLEARLARAAEALEWYESRRQEAIIRANATLATMTELEAKTDDKLPTDRRSWSCPINYPECTKNCGDYACGN